MFRKNSSRKGIFRVGTLFEIRQRTFDQKYETIKLREEHRKYAEIPILMDLYGIYIMYIHTVNKFDAFECMREPIAMCIERV